jgi:hypothetical protein
LDAASHHALLGKRCVLISSGLPLERDECLAVADAALTAGSSVRLLVLLPPSGAAARDEASLRLLQLSTRQGFLELMQDLGFQYGGVAGQYGTGNRPRIDFVHVRADDVEMLALALTDADLLLLHTPRVALEDPRLAAARWRLQRMAFGYVLRRLRAGGMRLYKERGGVASHVRWAWLGKADGTDGPLPQPPPPIAET